MTIFVPKYLLHSFVVAPDTLYSVSLTPATASAPSMIDMSTVDSLVQLVFPTIVGIKGAVRSTKIMYSLLRVVIPPYPSFPCIAIDE